MGWFFFITLFLCLAVAGVWAYPRLRGGRGQARAVGRRRRDIAAGRPEAEAEEDEEAFAETLADLSGLVKESRGESEPVAEPLAAGGRRRATTRRRHPSQMDLSFDETDDEPVVGEHVVALYLKAPEGETFGGEELQQALAAVDLRYGEMSIFHHFGIGKLYAPSPLFSVADMFEPGTIDINRIDDFSTRGLAFFLRVPARVDSTLVFELMLNTGQRLAERLGGELLDDTHAPLTTQAIGQLRKLVKEHDPR